jgi:hypothetical protein
LPGQSLPAATRSHTKTSQRRIQWFNDWNSRNDVLEWSIKRFIREKNTIVVEWFFECKYNKNVASFDGVSIIEFDKNNKIIIVKEFESKSEHIFPYNEN